MSPMRVPYLFLVKKPHKPCEFGFFDSLEAEARDRIPEMMNGLEGRDIKEIEIYLVRPVDTMSLRPTHCVW